MRRAITTITGLPTIAVLADMSLDPTGVRELARWVKAHRPECLPDEYDPDDGDESDEPGDALADSPERLLFPHQCRRFPDALPGDPRWGAALTDDELLVELAGRKCYDSFGLKAGRKDNATYIADTQAGEVPHRSITYHAKMTFFFGDLSRRVSHELIRNYVGADRDEEGAPSQESTRFTEHYGYFVAPPYVLRLDPGERSAALSHFEVSAQRAFDDYLAFIEREATRYRHRHGAEPKGLDRKRIFEAASHYLPHSAATSFVWTTNPAALGKLLVERDNPLADAEFQRFARYLKVVCVRRWPNLFQCFADEFRRVGLDVAITGDPARDAERLASAMRVDLGGSK